MSQRGFLDGMTSYSSRFTFNSHLKFSKSRKGQVTIFIIVGILLLLAVILILLLRRESTGFGVGELFPSQKGKVENFVSECIGDVGERALRLSGSQGGYVELPARYTQDQSWNLPNSPLSATPLWANGNQVDYPDFATVKRQIDTYIEENVRSCLFGSGAFEESFVLEEISEITADTDFADSRTTFRVSWQILVRDSSGELVAELEEYAVRSSIPFKSMYDSAVQILIAELNELKLEDITQDLIALEHEHVPVSGIDFSCVKRRWKVQDTYNSLKDLLRVNIRALRVEGTEFLDYSDLQPYYQNHYVWSVAGVNPDLSVRFRFEENYPFAFQVTPTDGEYLESSQLGGSDLLSFLCVQQWKFTYDVVYPVEVQIRDPDSGAPFDFAFSVHLLRNYPNREQMTARESLFVGSTSNSQYCEDPSYAVPMAVHTFSEVDSPSQGVYFRDALDDVDISYTCLRHRCELGTSNYEFESTGNQARLEALVPYCSQAVVRGEKEGFAADWQLVSSQENAVVELDLEPLAQFPLEMIELEKYLVVAKDCEEGDVGYDAENPDEGLCFEISENAQVEGLSEQLDEDQFALVTISLIEAQEFELEESEDDGLGVTGLFATLDPSGQNTRVFNQFTIEGSGHDALSLLGSDASQEAVFELLAQADFDYTVKVLLTDDSELVGGYYGVWEAKWFELREGQTISIPVFEISPQEEGYFSFLSEIESYTSLVPGVTVQ